MKIVADANIPFVSECFSSLGEVEVVPGRKIRSAVVADADVLLVRSITPVGADLLDGSNVQFVGTATIGFDHVDVEYLERKNIGFASAPGSNANSAAEYVIAALLAVGRRHNIVLEGKSVGIVGVGNVGSRVAKKAVALGMTTYLNDPPLQRRTGAPKYLPIEELFDCDFVTLHTPLTFEGVDKTFHLADERFFTALKAGCVFINASRGAVVDSVALKSTVNSGKLRATVLDVWENEPNIDTKLLQMVDTATAHIAGYSLDGKVAGMLMVYKAVCEHFGLEAQFDIGAFLPEPEVSELRIDPNSGGEQEVLLGAVQNVYDIGEDDRRLRQILDQPAEKRGAFFDGLRKDYPVRREFQNTRVAIEPACQAVADKLSGIGFRVADDRR